MKRTTYIIMGLILGGFVGMVGFVHCIEKLGKAENPFRIQCPERSLTMKTDGIRAVKVLGYPQVEDVTVNFIGDFIISPAGTSDQASLTYPETEFLQVSRVADTLLVEFRLSEQKLSEKAKRWNNFFVENIKMTLHADSTLVYVDARSTMMKLRLEQLSLDSLAVYSCGVRTTRGYGTEPYVELDSCALRSFALDGSSVSFRGRNCRIENFYLNLNASSRWTFKNSEVGREYLNGRGSFNCKLEKGECKQVIWTPADEKSSLNVELKEGARVLVNN